MGWKEFLKPDRRKILITIVLGGIIASLTILVMKIGIRFTFLADIPNTQIIYPVIILANIIYWYLLSCLILLVYEKKKTIRRKRTVAPKKEIRVVDWKGFLKPTKKKIILATILLIIGWLRYFIPNSLFYWLSFIVSFPLMIFNLFGPFLNQLLDIAESTKSLLTVLLVLIVAVTIFIIYFYLLSCLIVWIYEKKFKKSKAGR